MGVGQNDGGLNPALNVKAKEVCPEMVGSEAGMLLEAGEGNV